MCRRMLAWINGSNLTGYWGSDTPWWKVGPGGEVVEVRQERTEEERAKRERNNFFDSLEPAAVAAAVAAKSAAADEKHT